MSETAAPLNVTKEISNWCRRLGGMYAKDLKAIDESTFTTSPGGKARTIAEFTGEVCGFNMMVAGGLRGEPMARPDAETEAEFVARFANKAFAIQSIVSTANQLADAFASCSSEDLANEITAPWGESMSKFALANIAISHIMYHDAQLNYIQSLQGDADMHWFDEA